MTLNYELLCQSQLITWCVPHHFEDEEKEDTHGVSSMSVLLLLVSSFLDLISGDQVLLVNTDGLSRGGFTLNG